jgi:transcriptional regulator with XRE-family HTH domain
MARYEEDNEVAARVRGHLRQQIRERGITKAELARRLRSDDGNLTRILQGERVPTVGLVLRICRVLRLSPTRVLEEDAPTQYLDQNQPATKRRNRVV